MLYGKSFSDAYLEAESLGFSYPVQGKHHTTSAKPKHTTSSPSLSEQYFKRHPIEAGEKYLPWSREVGRNLIHEHLCSLQHSRDHRKRSRVGGEGVILGILGGGVPPGSPNADPISDQKLSVFTPVFIPDFRPGIGRNYVIIT